ncbi:hypothetical protein D3C78_1940270 [compost metagenome]
MGAGDGDVEGGHARDQPGRHRVLQILLALEQARQHQAAEDHRQQAADRPEALA